MKKSIVILSIALLVVSLGASLAMAAPTTTCPQGMMGQGTGTMMNGGQKNEHHQQTTSGQHDGMVNSNNQGMKCLKNNTPPTT